MRRFAKKDRGQTAVETAFVFSMLLFLTFAVVNFAILVHTKNIANYAAFMAGRSYQVLGDQTGASYFKEGGGQGAKKQNFLGDLGKTVAAFRVAEDVFTCSLPWMTVPQSDMITPMSVQALKLGGATSRCQEGKRKYQKTNIGKSLSFTPFKKDSTNPTQNKLDEVAGSFTEKGRLPLRYGILNLKYRTPLLYNPMGVFGGSSLITGEAHIPILLNPELEAGLQKKEANEKDFDDEKK